MIVQVVDGGSTAITRGGRVKADYEGKGLMKALFYHLAEWAAKQGVNAIMSTADESDPATAKVEPVIPPVLTWVGNFSCIVITRIPPKVISRLGRTMWK